MYTPSFNRIDDSDEIRRFVAATRSAEFVTVDPDGTPVATLLPIMWNDGTVVAHIARANPQWKTIAADSPALLICSGPEAYISPSWYAAKAEHGRVVPTWNYSAVHLSGTVRVHEDREWLRDVVTRLTAVHENGRSEPWASQRRTRALHRRPARGHRRTGDHRHPRRGQGEAEPEPF